MTNIPRLVDPTMVIGYSCISTTDRHVAPNGCTTNAVGTRPCTRWHAAVVTPQVGQGIP